MSSSATSPNIDMNSRWEGVVVFEDGGQIYVTPVPSPGSGPAAAIPLPGAIGSQPDIAVHYDIDMYTVTYVIPGSGELEINNYSFSELVNNGTANSVTPWGPFPPQSYFENPRIAVSHNQLGNNAPDFTVVAEDGNNIYAFIHSQMGPVAGGVNMVQVNDFPSFSCAIKNSFPVVAYSFHPLCSSTVMEIAIAWASDYTPCGFIGGTPNQNSILLKSFDLNSLPLSNSMPPCNYSTFRYNEVNLNNGIFNQSRPGITHEYDGDYLVIELNESITFFNQSNDHLYWKNRDNFDHMYKIGKRSVSEINNSSITFFNNSLEKTFTINTEFEVEGSIGIFSTLGQCAMHKEISGNQNEFIYNYSSLPSGTYVVIFQSEDAQESWKFSVL